PQPPRPPLGRVDREQPAVGETVEAERERRDAGHELAPAVRVDGEDLLRRPVRPPEAARGPAGRPSTQRGDSPNAMPSATTRRVLMVALLRWVRRGHPGVEAAAALSTCSRI